MITQQTYAVLALHVYDAIDEDSKPKLPTGWTELPPVLVGTSGFAYAVYAGQHRDQGLDRHGFWVDAGYRSTSGAA